MANIANIGANPSLDLMVAVVAMAVLWLAAWILFTEIVVGQIAGTHHKLFYMFNVNAELQNVCFNFVRLSRQWLLLFAFFALAMLLHSLVFSRKCGNCWCVCVRVFAEQIDACGVGFSYSASARDAETMYACNMKIIEINCAMCARCCGKNIKLWYVSGAEHEDWNHEEEKFANSVNVSQ